MAATCLLPSVTPATFPGPAFDPPVSGASELAEAILAGGCFWCTEAVYRQLDGVQHVESGYSGGSAETANYKAVCTDATGHAEAIRIVYDPHRISYGQLLKVFFSVAHDPTQLNRQGEDIGTQYRSAIFHADETQREIARRYIAQLDEAKVFSAPIVTSLELLQAFYPAEDYHQDYAAQHPDQPFIRAAAAPKVEKVKAWYADRIKSK
ncbi:peptide-methionine (S)-S-oxide reductase MsrA [Xanthomonadaceae bacterium JHOS43]|nr:peptide-methionine (S)-S-oxide reductase MsrA [Xanthomonadaceae bacterium JHOS43]